MLRILKYMHVCVCVCMYLTPLFIHRQNSVKTPLGLAHTHTQTLQSVFVTINNYLPASTKLASNARFIHNLIFYCFHLIII